MFLVRRICLSLCSRVKEVESGYAGGNTKNPDYRSICSGTTGHAEVVKVSFDSEKISLREILEIFFATHDPQHSIDKEMMLVLSIVQLLCVILKNKKILLKK